MFYSLPILELPRKSLKAAWVEERHDWVLDWAWAVCNHLPCKPRHTAGLRLRPKAGPRVPVTSTRITVASGEGEVTEKVRDLTKDKKRERERERKAK